MSSDEEKESSSFLKKILTLSVGTVFLTEEAIRTLVKDVKLPKELVGTILESAQKTKSEFFEKFTKEALDRLKGQIHPKELLQEILERNQIDVQMSIRFRKKDSDL